MKERIHSETIPPNYSELLEFDKMLFQLRKIVETKMALSKIFSTIHQKMSRGSSYQDILDYVFMSLDKIIPFDRIGIALLEDQNRKIRLNWVKSKLPINSLREGYVADLHGSGLENIIMTEEPRIINDLVEYLRIHPYSKSTELAISDGIKANLTCPLIINGITIGVIFLSSGNKSTYGMIHIDLLLEIAQGLSLIIEKNLLDKKTVEVANKEKFFRDTIHDLKNPLSIIKGTLDLIEKKKWFAEIGDDSKKAIQILSRNSDSMTALVLDLLRQEELKLNSTTINYTRHSIHEFLSEILIDCEVLAKNKNTKIVLDEGTDINAEAYFDHFKIKVSLENLISNAIKYSKEYTQITFKVHTSENNEKLSFLIIDQGQGISTEEHKNLFKSYGKTSSRPTAGETSTGLGLANVKRIINAHGGDVFVKSELGKGSTFGFWIPLRLHL